MIMWKMSVESLVEIPSVVKHQHCHLGLPKQRFPTQYPAVAKPVHGSCRKERGFAIPGAE